MNYIEFIKQQIAVIKERDPAIKTSKEVFLYPSFKAMLKYRKAHKLYLKGKYYKARKISQKAARKTGIEIHPGAVIGKNFFIDHGFGVVIGETTIIGDDVLIYQQVTLGGTGNEHGKRHPTTGNGVIIGAGAKVLGNITIGDNTRIGAGSVVVDNVPEHCTVVGIPGRIVQQKFMNPDGILMHNRIPDPVKCEINRLKYEIQELKDKILQLENLKNEQS